MAEEHTPTLDEVRECYCDSESSHENHGGAWITEEQHARHHAKFDRWLADYTARVLEEAADYLDQRKKLWYGDGGVTVWDDYPNGDPVKLTDWLRARAAEYRKGKRDE